MLQLPPSEAGGERSFKVFNRTFTQLRNRLSSDKADKQTRIAFNLAQLERFNVVQADRHTRLELNMLIELGLAPTDAMPGESAAAAGAVVDAVTAVDGVAGRDSGDGGGGLGGGGSGVAPEGGGREGGGDSDEDRSAVGAPAEEDPPVVESDGAMKLVGTEEF